MKKPRQKDRARREREGGRVRGGEMEAEREREVE